MRHPSFSLLRPLKVERWALEVERSFEIRYFIFHNKVNLHLLSNVLL